MNTFLEIMLAPFIACLILTGMHSYLGLHVLTRGVIFVDLALAQLAALGITVAALFGYSLHSTQSYWFSLAFTIAGATLFASTRLHHSRIPPEAFIGIMYAVASAASMLVLHRVAEGGEELKSLLVGHLLFISWEEIIEIGVIYGLLGIFHYAFYDRFILVSENLPDARQKGVNVWGLDFLFYASFGVVVTSSVELAGILLVFSFLIVPAVCGALLSERNSARLLIGWVTAFIVTSIGLYVSYQWDLPTGATIVCAFGAVLFILIVMRFLFRILLSSTQ